MGSVGNPREVLMVCPKLPWENLKVPEVDFEEQYRGCALENLLFSLAHVGDWLDREKKCG